MLLGSMANAQEFDFGCIDYVQLRLDRQQEIIGLSVPNFLNVFSREKGAQDEIVMQDNTGLSLLAEQTLGLGRLEYILQTNWDTSIAGPWANEVTRVKNLVVAEVNTTAAGELTGIFADADNSPSDSQLTDYPVLDFKVTNLTDLNSRVAYIVNSLTANGVTVSRFNGSIFTVAQAGKTTVDVQYITNDLNGPALFRNLYFQLVQTKYNLLHSNEDLVAKRASRIAEVLLLDDNHEDVTITRVDRIASTTPADAFDISDGSFFIVTQYHPGIYKIEEMGDTEWDNLVDAISDKVNTLVFRAERIAQVLLLDDTLDNITITYTAPIFGTSTEGFVINNTSTLRVGGYSTNGETLIQNLLPNDWNSYIDAISDEIDYLNVPLIPTGLTSEQFHAANAAADNNTRHTFLQALDMPGVVNVSALLFNDDGEFLTFSDPNGIHESISVNSAQFGQSTVGDLTGLPFRDYYLFCILAIYQIQYPQATALSYNDALAHIFSSTTEPGYIIDSIGAEIRSTSASTRGSLFEPKWEGYGDLNVTATGNRVIVSNSANTESYDFPATDFGSATIAELGEGAFAAFYLEALRGAWNIIN